MNTDFITYLAWIFGVLATLLFIARFVGHMTYSDIDRIRDAAKGVSVSFPMTKPFIVATVCWAWIFTN